jgi:endonuclease YncB( thermonuclease family)
MRFLNKFAIAMALPLFAPSEPFPPLADVSYSQPSAGWTACPSPYVVDGDTIRCGSERVRLLGIDAPELPGHCARNRQCAPGDGFASTESLRKGVGNGTVRYRTVTYDRYGRAVAIVEASGRNLSCWQLEKRQAVYKGNWDNGGLIADACR